MLGWKIHVLKGLNASYSDYAPFRDIGIPAAWFWEDHPYYHTEKDTIEYAVNLENFKRSLRINFLLVAKLTFLKKQNTLRSNPEVIHSSSEELFELRSQIPKSRLFHGIPFCQLPPFEFLYEHHTPTYSSMLSHR